MTLCGEGVQPRGGIPLGTVAIARSCFPNPNSAMDRLFELFPDKYPELVAESGDEWTFALAWPRHILEPIDPLLAERARSCFATELSDLDQYVDIEWHDGIPFVFSMFHSWAIIAPSLVMNNNRESPRVIVHVDAHHDLAPSLMGVASPGWLVSQVLGMESRLDKPKSIETAVRAGLINKANFLTAYLLATTRGRLVHVEMNRVPEEFELKPITVPISIGNSYLSQQEFTFEPPLGEGGWSILESPEVPKSLGLAPNQAVWLDIDLDAFCNRFDGDSDNRNVAGSHREAVETLGRAKRSLSDLSKADWLGNVVAVSIAASPGFFPSEYWEAVIPAVRDGVRRLLAR